MDKFERDIFLKMYNDMLDLYKNSNEDYESGYYEPLVRSYKFDNIDFSSETEHEYVFNRICSFTHLYNNLKVNNILIDKRELLIDKIIEE